MLAKSELRNKLRNLRRGLSVAEQDFAARAVIKNITPLVAAANSVALYHACNGELNLDLLGQALLCQGKQIYQPLAFRHTRQLQFEKYRWEAQPIFYPENYQPSGVIAAYELDLVILPLVAADLYAHRLGQGGGYYDSTFAASRQRAKPKLCGVGYHWQLLAEIPHDSWDLSLDYFVSEQTLLSY